VRYGTNGNGRLNGNGNGNHAGFVNYLQGANIAGFIKVANSMIDQGLV
jgi:hypothetical protein